MGFNLQNPLIVQSDRSMLLEVANPRYEDARDCLARFAELEKSPEHIHTYRISPISLWNAAAAGHEADQIVGWLGEFSKYPVPENVAIDIRDYIGKFGKLKLVEVEGGLRLLSDDMLLLEEVSRSPSVGKHLAGWAEDRAALRVKEGARGLVKQALIKVGFPVEDLAGYLDGAPLDFDFATAGGFGLRRYQEDAARAFFAAGSARGGTGVVVLPCGAGKTIVGMAAMHLVKAHTLVLTTGRTAVNQWRRELLEKTSLTADQVGLYTSEEKSIRPVTISTYQILTYRKSKVDPFLHFDLFARGDWGLLIYDEVHLLPAPVFRATADIQARRRLGLTATLVREDGREDDVFTLVGPKKYDLPWKELEAQGWIATAHCVEARVDLEPSQKSQYALASARGKFRLASENPRKTDVVRSILARHRGDNVLVIGAYLNQLRLLARSLKAPLITGQTPQAERDRLYDAFRAGEIKLLVVSKVANFAIDLPDASVAIQVSGTFGSRQEEAQRLGRILRPKSDGGLAHFYSVVTRASRDQEFAVNRQLFLTEQGYSYRIVDAATLAAADGPAANGAAADGPAANGAATNGSGIEAAT